VGSPCLSAKTDKNGGGVIKIHAFLTLTLDEGEWSASRFDRFNPCESASGKC
jgi:hypothetical protein